MIRRGKQEGWLSLPYETIPSFLKLYDIQSPGVRASKIRHRGNGLIALRSADANQEQPSVVIPHDVILSKESVWEHAKIDQRLREVLEACGEIALVCAPGFARAPALSGKSRS